MNGRQCGAKNCSKLSREEATSCLHRRKCRSCRRSCRVCKTTQLQRRKNMGRWAKRNEQLRIETENVRAEMEDDSQQIHEESLVETELDLEIRASQAGEGRNGSCMDPAFLPNFLHLARQQLVLLHNEFGKTDGMQHQPAPVTPIHVPTKKAATDGQGDENDEEQRKAAGREHGPSVLGGSQWRFPAGSVFDASLPPRNGAGKGNGDEFKSPRGGDESGGRQA